MRVFLTGATGYIGSAVGEALRNAGHDVIGLVRTADGMRRLWEHGITPHGGDLNNPEAVAETAAAADATVHTALGRDANAPLADEALVDAVLARFAGTNKTFVYTSGVWVMGNTKKGADEESPLDPPPLVAWRVGVEQKVLQAAGNGIRTVVLRPGMVYGRYGGIVPGFFQSARETGTALVVGGGDNHWSFVHIDDLADLYVRALDAKPGSLYIAATEVQRVRDVAEAASRAAGAEGRVQTWTVEEAFHHIGPAVEGLVLDQRISTRKAESELGWKPKARRVIDEMKHASDGAR